MVGRNVPPPIESFNKLQNEFSLGPALVQNLQASGYTHPTPIQMQAVPIMLQVWICCLDIFSYCYGSAARNQEKRTVYRQRDNTGFRLCVHTVDTINQTDKKSSLDTTLLIIYHPWHVLALQAICRLNTQLWCELYSTVL